MLRTLKRFSASGRAVEVPDREAGLTLIEILVVLAIIAVMAYLIVPNVIGRPDQARVTVAQTDLRTISAALKMYRLDNGDYPTTQQGLVALAQRPTSTPVPANWSPSGYLEQLPVDPWGRPYVYSSPGQGGSGFEIVSLGKDGKPGGEELIQTFQSPVNDQPSDNRQSAVNCQSGPIVGQRHHRSARPARPV